MICVLLPDQWDVQDTIKRLVASLKKRGYVVWFGAHAPHESFTRMFCSSLILGCASQTWSV